MLKGLLLGQTAMGWRNGKPFSCYMAGVWAAQAEGCFLALSFSLAFAWKLWEKTKEDELMLLWKHSVHNS